MRIPMALSAVVFVAAGCAATVASRVPYPDEPSGNVVVVAGNEGRARVPRGLSKVPPGHYPPPGQCRIWYLGWPPGQQPPPAPCESFHGRVPFGTFILFGGKPWDTEYDWARHERQTPSSVPEAVLRLMIMVRVP